MGKPEASEVGSGWAAVDAFAGSAAGGAQQGTSRAVWEAVARSSASVDAAAEAGVSAGRWCPVVPGGCRDAPVCDPFLAFGALPVVRRAAGDRAAAARGCGVREIARELGRTPSPISRELRRNAATRSGGPEYWA